MFSEVQLNVNFDQIGVYILPSNGTTFKKCGSEQVDILAKDKKYAYTLLVASSADGDFLPFQQVWAGATERSLPSAHTAHIDDVCEQGFDFAFAKSEKNKGSHYSTLKTMKEICHSLSTFLCLYPNYYLLFCYLVDQKYSRALSTVSARI